MPQWAWTSRARCPQGGTQLCQKACHFPLLKNAKKAQKFQDTSKFLSFEVFMSLLGSLGNFWGLLGTFEVFYGGGKQLALPKQKRNFVLFLQDISKELTQEQLRNMQVFNQTPRTWYFVTKTVLTYSEKKQNNLFKQWKVRTIFCNRMLF